MEDEVLQWLLKGTAAVNAGPNAREIFRVEMENEYNNGNILNSVFYQVMMLYQAFELRYMHSSLKEDEEPSAQELMDNFNDWEKQDFKQNPLMQFVYKELLAAEAKAPKPKPKPKKDSPLKLTNFLLNVSNPEEGIQRIESVCQQMPKEWTIIQLCKGPRPETSYSVYSKIHESGAAIYLTLLRHARSGEYPAPICLRMTGPEERELFKKFAQIADRFKLSISVDPAMVQTKEAKEKYWKNLADFETFVSGCLSDFRSFFYPWLFLFTGSLSSKNDARYFQYQKKAFRTVDDFCDSHHWEPNERVLLSLTALHVCSVSKMEQEAICQALTSEERQRSAAVKMLAELHNAAATLKLMAAAKRPNSTSASASHLLSARKHNPCILIVDERLDHFYWEELNVEQEFSRVNSLHCLWRLQQLYKDRIRSGYLQMNVESGGCLLNPDCNLEKTEMRMKSFLSYWTPHFLLKAGQRPKVDELNKDFFKRDCFVYAGHGSGLQYINGRHLAKQHVTSVVFLFGCDSSRLRSNGLYSELIGAHLYYHAALCPALIGTLLPGLDGNMDTVASAILSQWIAPQSKSVLPWNEIDTRRWAKEGVIKVKSKDRQHLTMADTPDYHVASLCEIISRIHQRRIDPKLYNTVGYVCRGLPAWNCHV